MISKLLTSTLLLISVFCTGQELFSDAFQGNLPFSIVAVENDIYVSTAISNSEFPLGIYKISITDPSNIEQIVDVSELATDGVGILDMTYDSIENTLIGSIGQTLLKVSLNQSFPGNFEIIFNNHPIDINGELAFSNGFVYFIDQNSETNTIFKTSTAINSTPTTFYTTQESFLRIAGIFNDYLYFSERNENGNYDLFKLSLSENTDNPTIVSGDNSLSLSPQTGYIQRNNLFVALEALEGENDRIVKYDLSNNEPVDLEIILEESGVVLGITSIGTDLYFSTNLGQNINFIPESSLNVSENELINIAVYPNPATDILFIDSSVNEPLEFEIIDILGKKLKEGTYTNNGIQLSDLSNGLYFLNLNTEDNTSSITYKFLKN